MKLNSFISKLNWRQILVHSVASCFFIQGFRILSFLHNPEFFDLIGSPSDQDRIDFFEDPAGTGYKVTYYILWTYGSRIIGLLVAFIVSIAIKRNWFWVNSLIPIIILYLLMRMNLHEWIFVKPFSQYLNLRLHNVIIEILLNGLILLTIGLSLFTLKSLNKFIEYKRLVIP
jgi:hypothetical protein